MSPRGTIEVLDDYPYWVGKKFGYFGDIETTLEPGPSDATATRQARRPEPGRHGLSRRRASSRSALAQGIPLVSVFEMGGADVFDFAFRKGEAPADIKGLEGKTIVLGSAGWQSIADPMLKAAGVDITKVKYVDAGWPTWGTAVMSGQGDTALSWEGLRAQWKGQGLDFDYILGRNFSKLPANSFVIRKADFDDAAKKELYANYLKGWAAGLEFGQHQPARRDADRHGAVPRPLLADEPDGRDRVDDAARQRLRRPLGRAQEVGLPHHPELAAVLRRRPRDRPDHRPTSRPRTWSRTTSSTAPTSSTPPRSRRTPTASRCRTTTRRVDVAAIQAAL